MCTRFALLTLMTAAAAGAGAFQFSVVSGGTADYNDVTGIANETVLGSNNLPSGFDTLTLNFITDTGEYFGAGGNLSFSLAINGGGYPDNNGTYYTGVWTYDPSSTGNYANLTGGGTFSFGIDNQNGNIFDSNTGLVGNLAATPEPASLAALSIGAIALLRRRKRA